jgi:hypothetical protein
MNNEKAGERVFADVDRALAGRIVSRSLENSREAATAADANHASYEVDGAGHREAADDFPLLPVGSLPLVKMAALLLALFVVMILIFRRKEDNDD